MQIREFFVGIQSYYGKYNLFMKKCIEEYFFKKCFTEKQISLIFNHLIRTFSSEYNKQPDISVIEKAVKKIKIGRVIVDNYLYEDGEKIGHYPNGCDLVLFDNPVKEDPDAIDYSEQIKELMDNLNSGNVQKMKRIKQEGEKE